MESRTFTYGQNSRDIQVHSLLWPRRLKSMTVKQTTTRKKKKNKPKEQANDVLCQSATFRVIHKQRNRGHCFFCLFVFSNSKKIVKHVVAVICTATDQLVGPGSDSGTTEFSGWERDPKEN